MRKDRTIAVILGTAHLMSTPGKTSPDGRLRECKYSRETAGGIKARLEAYGYTVFVDYEPVEPRPEWTAARKRLGYVKGEQSMELGCRARQVNAICGRYGKENCLYVSIHVNASGSDGQWHDEAGGWQVCVGTKASGRSRRLAECLFDAARAHGLKVRQPAARQKYWEQGLRVLNETACPAVLTENLFQDNKRDVGFLLSDEGRAVIETLHVEGIVKYIELLP